MTELLDERLETYQDHLQEGELVEQEEEEEWHFSDGEWISRGEWRFRRRLFFAFRLCLASFLSVQLWDFLFSPIWMHGYLWALNVPAIAEQDSQGADKSALAILDQQLANVGPMERALHGLLSTLGVWLLLHRAGFGHGSRSVWALVRLALCVGGVSGLARAVQTRQRLLPIIHECFYACVLVILVGLCLTLRMPSNSTVEGYGSGTGRPYSNPVKEDTCDRSPKKMA